LSAAAISILLAAPEDTNLLIDNNHMDSIESIQYPIKKFIPYEFNANTQLQIQKEFKEKHRTYVEELKIILSQKDGYKLNMKKKLIKHYPTSVDNTGKKIKKCKQCSFSISNMSLKEHLKHILQEAEQRGGFLMIFNPENLHSSVKMTLQINSFFLN
jgi:hypothetical protein